MIDILRGGKEPRAAMPSLYSAFSRLLPKSRLEGALYVFIFLCAIRPWTLDWILFPQDPASVRVIYRSPQGDIEYFPLINALARGQFGESAVYESQGIGLQSFPLGSIAYHSLGTAFFGPFWGYLLADVFVTFLFFWLLRSWCRLFSSNELWTSFIAALYSSGVLSCAIYFAYFLRHLGLLWGDRIPRPFVADIYLLAGMILMTSMIWSSSMRARVLSWLLLGGILALSLQSYVYFIPTLGLGLAFLVLQWFWEDRRAFPLILSRVAYLALSFSILIIPFVYQRIYEPSEGPARLGLFPVNRWTVWFQHNWMSDANTTIGLALVAILAGLSFYAPRLGLPSIPRRVLVFFAALQVASYLAWPLSATLTGKLIQPYHFPSVSGAIQTALLVALVAYLGLRVLPRYLLNPAVAGILLAISFCAIPYHVISQHFLSGTVRQDQDFNGPGYHAAFTQLVRELGRDDYKDSEVMATIDDQVYTYWVGFRGKSAFFPDANFTTLSEQKCEDRVLWFAREVNLDEKSLLSFLSQSSVLVDWMGGQLYQCSGLYSKAPMSDYSAGALVKISEHTDGNTWSLMLPLSDERRLQNRYLEILAKDRQEKPRLDLIVLSANKQAFPLPDPDHSQYALTYQNDYFRVWKAIKPASQ